jgi:hypothetical protein
MVEPYNEIPTFAALTEAEKLAIVKEIGPKVVKSKSYFLPFIGQIAVFIAMLIWLPRGTLFYVVVFAYIIVTMRLLRMHSQRLMRKRIAEHLASDARQAT